MTGSNKSGSEHMDSQSPHSPANSLTTLSSVKLRLSLCDDCFHS